MSTKHRRDNATHLEEDRYVGAFALNSFACETKGNAIEAYRYLAVTFDSIDEGITIYDSEFRLVAWNKKFAEMNLVPRGELKIGRCLLEGYRQAACRGIFGKGDPIQLAEAHITELLEGRVAPQEDLLIDNRIIRIKRHYLTGGGICAVFSDVTEEKAAKVQLYQQANFDNLTGLPNRYWARKKLQDILEEASRDHMSTAVFFLDLNSFKGINDTFGHEIGDKLLCAVANRLRNALSDNDLIARIGGDEFLVLLPKTTAGDVATIAAQLLATLKSPILIDDQQIYVSASIGIALAPHDGTDTCTLWRRADTAMYVAKTQSPGSFQRFLPMMASVAERRTIIANNLRNAISQGELSLCYQPIVTLHSMKLYGVEALLRWHNPVLGDVPADEFVRIAEESGDIVAMGRWVLETACRDIWRINKIGSTRPLLAINVSARELWEPGFSDHLVAVMRAYGISPSQIELELTERSLVSESAAAMQTIEQLQALKIRISIDDFGTGFSSLSALRRLPISTLKIDQSFISEIPGNPEAVTIAKTVMAMAGELNLDLVAEGVSNQAQVDFLLQSRCQFGQGYWISRPVPIDDLIRSRLF